ncbi:hypothetical protein A5893_03620 [Pedobacter psychrophilus]|uniref:DUF4251 domain-containing protein n=1 Tax=Pedobacter psychrophilus TaxID=1826909 RepID=A0A179DME6_9SPHI|nr:DUF4251 domain-containing protein [Pedobacter psychrophilus]OAQ42215.1 hypothetical protein A5893_03620 [Pedobacter psychrophilus]
MKNLFSFKYLILIFISLTILSSCATQKEKQARITLIDSLIKNNDFKFVAQQANPLRGGLISQRLRQLDNSYFLKISKDSINCYLPYFGVAQQAPYGSTNNGIQFISTDFSYDKTVDSKGGYQITISPKNTDKARTLYLMIGQSGNATLNVNSNNRDAISFTGNIEKR